MFVKVRRGEGGRGGEGGMKRVVGSYDENIPCILLWYDMCPALRRKAQ